jgi:hypothetical protein
VPDYQGFFQEESAVGKNGSIRVHQNGAGAREFSRIVEGAYGFLPSLVGRFAPRRAPPERTARECPVRARPRRPAAVSADGALPLPAQGPGLARHPPFFAAAREVVPLGGEVRVTLDLDPVDML